MALCDKIHNDLKRVYMNLKHFAEWHTWNGKRFQCIIDEDTALKRKNNNVVDVNWDNNTSETLFYALVEDFPGRAMPNEHVVFDNELMKVSQVQEDMGMYTILLISNDPKAVSM